MAIKLIVDSACDINQKEADNLGIILLPIEVRFDQEIYLDGVDITPIKFYEKLVESDQLPTTSQINPYRFEQVYEQVIKSGDQAIVITLSSKLSGTYNNAKLAAEKYNDNIYVVDSLNACVGERLLIQYALKLIKEDKLDIEQIVDILNNKKTKINVLAMLDTLLYLKKGGRISAFVAFSGELLSIKPVIGVIDGEVKLVGKARGSKNGNNLLCKLVSEKGGIDFSMPYGVVYSGFSDATLKKYVKDSEYLWQGHTDELPIYIIGCTIGTHVGPGTIGVAFFEK